MFHNCQLTKSESDGYGFVHKISIKLMRLVHRRTLRSMGKCFRRVSNRQSFQWNSSAHPLLIVLILHSRSSTSHRPLWDPRGERWGPTGWCCSWWRWVSAISQSISNCELTETKELMTNCLFISHLFTCSRSSRGSRGSTAASGSGDQRIDPPNWWVRLYSRHRWTVICPTLTLPTDTSPSCLVMYPQWTFSCLTPFLNS